MSRVGFTWSKVAVQIPFIVNRVIRGMSLPHLGEDKCVKYVRWIDPLKSADISRLSCKEPCSD